MTRQLISDQLIKNTAIAATEYFPGLRRKVKESEIVLDDPIIVSNNWRSKAACFAVKDFIELSQKEPYLDALPAGTQSMQEKYCMACPVARFCLTQEALAGKIGSKRLAAFYGAKSMEYGQVSHYIEGIGGSIQLRRIHKIALDDPRRQQSLELAAIVTNAVFDQPSDPIGYVHEILEASYSIQTRRIV